MRYLVATLMCFLLAGSVAFAQRDLGTIAGTVTDQTGAAIPNAKVTITEVATNQSYAVTTTAAGEYVRPALKPGIYTVSAEAKGSVVLPRRTSWSLRATASVFPYPASR